MDESRAAHGRDGEGDATGAERSGHAAARARGLGAERDDSMEDSAAADASAGGGGAGRARDDGDSLSSQPRGGRRRRGRRGAASGRREPVPAVPFWKLLGAIGNGAGIRYELLFHLLVRPRDVGWLARALDLDQPRVSQHLAELRKAGVVAATYENGHRVYAITGNARIIASSAQRRPSIAVIGSDRVGMVFFDLRGEPGGARIESLIEALTELATEQAAARSLGSSPPRAGAGRDHKAVDGASARSAAARPGVPAAERGGRANELQGAAGKGGEEVEVMVRAGLKGQAGEKTPPGA